MNDTIEVRRNHTAENNEPIYEKMTKIKDIMKPRLSAYWVVCSFSSHEVLLGMFPYTFV